MNVDDSLGELADELRCEDAHVANEDDEIDVVLFELLCELRVKFFARFIGRVDEKGFEALGAGALKGIAIFFVAGYEGEFDSGHVAGFDFVDDGLKVSTVCGGQDCYFEHAAIISPLG